MEINANSFSIRGESGIFRVVSDSPLLACAEQSSAEKECEIAIESDGFRVNRVLSLGMRAICSFLAELREIVRSRSGRATLSYPTAGLSVEVAIDGAVPWVRCAMDDRNEGKENSILVRYPIEPSYLEELECALGELGGGAIKAS
jgi:hypothetical protein